MVARDSIRAGLNVRSEHPLVAEYRQFSPTSASFADRAQAVFPGGDTRASAHYSPYPLVMTGGSGCRLRDVDGHEVVDFMNNFTSLIHGHAHPDVVAAVRAQIGKGSAYAAPNAEQIELAELIAEPGAVDRAIAFHQFRHGRHADGHPLRAGGHRAAEGDEDGGRLPRQL